MRFKHFFLLSGLLVVPAYATKLTFDVRTGAGSQVSDNSSIVQNYGDRVTAVSMVDGTLTYGYGSDLGFTPNVLASYGPASVTSTNTVTACPFNLTDTCVYLWSTGFGNLTNVIAQAADTANNGYGQIIVTLTADAGFLVRLASFDLAGWLNTNRTVGSVTVRDVVANTTVFSLANVVASGATSTPVNVGNLTARVFEITINSSNLANGNGQNVGLDNLIFGQVSEVPEPSTVALMGGALALAGLLRRRA